MLIEDGLLVLGDLAVYFDYSISRMYDFTELRLLKDQFLNIH